MRISLIETGQIEAHLLNLTDPGDSLVFEARLLLDAELKEKLAWQEKTYNVVRIYGRDQLKKEIENVHQKLFTQPEYTSFSQKIRRLFTNR